MLSCLPLVRLMFHQRCTHAMQDLGTGHGKRRGNAVEKCLGLVRVSRLFVCSRQQLQISNSFATTLPQRQGTLAMAHFSFLDSLRERLSSILGPGKLKAACASIVCAHTVTTDTHDSLHSSGCVRLSGLRYLGCHAALFLQCKTYNYI